MSVSHTVARVPSLPDTERVRQQVNRIEHETFGQLAAGSAARAGTFPGDAGQLVRDAGVLVGQVSGRCRDTVASAAKVAADKMAPHEGKLAVLRDLETGLAGDAAEKLATAENLLIMARAHLEVESLPKVPKGGEQLARTDARMVLDGIPANELTGRMRELAGREDPVGALVSSSWGADYLASRGQDAGLHRAVVESALAAAKDSTDARRAAAADALGRLHHMDGAILGAHQQVRHANGTDLKRIRGTIPGGRR